MKILFFIESLRAGGKERRIVELLKGLRDYSDIESELVLTKRDIHYKDVFDIDINVHFAERKFLKKDPGPFFTFFRICRDFDPDIIHAWGNMVAIYAIPTKVLQNRTLINSQITDAPLSVNSGILSHKMTFPFSDYIVSNSKAGLEAYDPPSEKSTYIHNGFDFDRLDDLEDEDEVRRKFDITTEKVVGMVASFTEKKDYGTYLQATKIVLEERKDVTFLCVGAGDDSGYRNIVNASFSDNVKFLGRQKDVESIMNICDVGVLATFTEGIPNTVMEFMALGKPVIATDGGGINELVLDEDTGYLIPQKSPTELAKKNLYLLKDEGVAQKMGESGRRRIREEFNLKKMVEEYHTLYKIAYEGGNVRKLR